MAATGQGQVALISGEPGIGKSRLIAAAEEMLANEPRTLHCFCSPHHVSSAFYPIMKLIERLTGIRRDDENDVRLNKVQNFLSEVMLDGADIGALVSELLSIEGTHRCRRSRFRHRHGRCAQLPHSLTFSLAWRLDSPF